MDINFNQKYQLLFKYNKDIFFYFLYSGRAAGKSFAIATYIALKLINDQGNLVFCRQYMTNTQTSVIPEFLDKIQLLGIRNVLKVNKDYIQCKLNGNKLWFKGLQTAQGTAEASLKGIPKLACVVIDQFQQVKEEAFDRLVGTVRDKKLKLSIVCALNPISKLSWQYIRFFKDLPSWNYTGIIGNKVYIYSSYIQNKKYLSDKYLTEIENLKEVDPIKYKNQFLGVWLDSEQKAALTKQLLELAEKKVELPEYFDFTVVAVDPAVTAKENSDDTGIVVVGYKNDQYFVLQDFTGIYQPSQWANIVKQLYDKYSCNVVVYQNNQGGLLVQENIRNSVGNFCQIVPVRATKGKLIRWEPCRALYELKKVHHVKHFSDLNYQLLTFGTSLNERSPGHLDALCWGLTYIAENNTIDSSGYV